MAIINAKRVEAEQEAERLARQQAADYAQRHDSAWQQPPPAYEESADSSNGTSSRQPLTESAASSSEPAYSVVSAGVEDDLESSRTRQESNGDRRRSENRTRQTADAGDHEDGNDSDESMPLLNGRERRRLKKTLRFKKKFRHILRMLGKMMIFTGLVLLILWLCGFLGFGAISTSPRRDPDQGDGDIVRDPSWSKPVKAPAETWPSPSVPLYESSAWFSFSTDHAVHFFHAKGSSYSGIVRYAVADEIEEPEWKSINDGQVNDRIAVHVLAQFTHVQIRDSVRVNKMRIEETDAEGVGIYANQLPNNDYAFIRFRIVVYLPTASRRTSKGLAYDKSSWIPQIEAITDNVRIAYETELESSGPGPSRSISFGQVRFVNNNGGVNLASTLSANSSISIKVINGQLRDIVFRQPRPFTIVAPKVNLAVINGPLMVSGVVAIDDITLRTGSGGLNISAIATARHVSGSTMDGVLGGYYAGLLTTQIHAKESNIIVDVNVAQDIYEKMVRKSGLHALLGPEAPDLEALGKGRWHEKTVDVRNEVGPIFVRYIDQSSETKLNSTVKSSTGSIDVVHSANFEGTFDLRTSVGTIVIPQPTDSDYLHRVFALDRDERWHLGEKLVRGRTWSSQHSWDQGGDRKNAAFPISSSTIVGQVGALKLRFE